MSQCHCWSASSPWQNSRLARQDKPSLSALYHLKTVESNTYVEQTPDNVGNIFSRIKGKDECSKKYGVSNLQ
jgi:hypothetical protein